MCPGVVRSDTAHQRAELDRILYLQITVNICRNRLVVADGRDLDAVPKYHINTEMAMKCIYLGYLIIRQHFN